MLFLTAGNKSDRGTIQSLTPYKRSVPQGLSCPPLATRTPPAHASPTPPFTTPPQKSHVIRLPENSTPPTNVAIPTVWFQSLKGLHGNYVRHFSATTPNGANGANRARTRPHTPTCQHMPTQLRTTEPQGARRPGLVASAHTPKVARNSATRKFGTAHKRCNSNGLVSKFERFTWELRATFFGNHAQRCQRCPHAPTHANAAPHHRTQDRHRAPASSRASTHTPAQ